MISYTWRPELSPAELADVDGLLAQAAADDEEAGFSTANPRAAAPYRGIAMHLLVAFASGPHTGAGYPGSVGPLAAYLRLDVSGGAGDASLVVRPEFRSHGIATLLLECLAADPRGWTAIPGLRELRAWAHGSHPAAERARSRVGGVTSGIVYKTLRPLGGRQPFAALPARLARQPASAPPREVLPGHQRAMAPTDRATLARARLLLRSATGGGGILVGADDRDPATFPACLALTGTVAEGRGPRTVGLPTADLPAAELRDLLAQGLLEVQAAGARTTQLYIDALHSTAVLVARELGFEHDHSDCRYALPLGESAVSH
jgi:mycothiol synthase